MGDDSRTIVEIWSCGVEFLPLGSTVGGKTHKEGNGDLGDGGLVHLECQKQVLL